MDHGIGVDGNGVLLAAGGYGEGYFLDDGELFALIDVLVDTAGDKAPTMVGVFDLNARTAARRSRYAGDAGIDFIELGLPHYSCPSEEDVYLYTKYVNDNADVGLMNYNNFWVTPAPKYEITRSLMERFIDLENVVGFKWSSASPAHYVGLLKLFADDFNFIDNGMMNSQGARFGMAGFVDFFGNVAPSLSLNEVGDVPRRPLRRARRASRCTLHFDTDNRLGNEAPAFTSVADGVFGHVRWEVMGSTRRPELPRSGTRPGGPLRPHSPGVHRKRPYGPHRMGPVDI